MTKRRYPFFSGANPLTKHGKIAKSSRFCGHSANQGCFAFFCGQKRCIRPPRQSKTAFGPGVWDHNLEEFQQRFDPELTDGQGPQRLKNLYFTYLVELRALAKAAPYLRAENFYTGNTEEDAEIKEVIHKFLDIVISFPDQFDESQLFKENSKQTKKLKLEFIHHFHNISRIMDCVGCDKCKLWGKLQILGMGTALKILFSGNSMAPDSTVDAKLKANFQLTRTEIVALFNSFGRLSSSIHAIETFRKLAR